MPLAQASTKTRTAARRPVARARPVPSRRAAALAPLPGPTLKRRLGQDFADAFSLSPAKGRRFVFDRINRVGGTDAERLADTGDLVQWGAAAGQPAQRRELIGAFADAKSELLLVHQISQLPAEQVAPFVKEYFDAGGKLEPILQWLRMAGSSMRGKPIAAPAVKTPAKRAAAARGFNPFKAVGDAIKKVGSAIGNAVDSLVDAVVKAGKSVAQAVSDAVNWTVGELTDLVEALVRAGEKVADILAAAAAKSLDLLKKYVEAMIAAGRSVAELALWAATQAADRVAAVVSKLLALGRKILDILKPVIAAGRNAVIAITRALLAAGKKVTDLLLAVAAEAIAVVQPLVDALLALNQSLRTLLVEAAKLAATACRTIVQALMALGNTLTSLLIEAANALGTTLKTIVQALFALGKGVAQLLIAVAAAAEAVVKALVGVLLSLGKSLAELVIAAVGQTVQCARALFKALLALGRKTLEVLVAVAGRGLSALRTALEALLAMGISLSLLVKDICTGVVEAFRRGFFEGLVALGKAPLQILKAAFEAGASVALLAFAVLLEMFGGYRGLLPKERAEAEIIYGSSIDLNRVQLGFAKLPGNVIDYVNLEIPRAFTTMYLLNFGPGSNVNMPTIIHELAHVWQGVQQGPLYMTRALEAQVEAGVKSLFHTGQYDDSKAYEVTEADLRAFAGDFSKFNPEQQAQIVENYWLVTRAGTTGLQPLDLLEQYAKQVFKPIGRARAAKKSAKAANGKTVRRAAARAG